MQYQYQIVEMSGLGDDKKYVVKTSTVEPEPKSTVSRERKVSDPGDAETFVFKSSKEHIQLLKETIDGGKLESSGFI